MVATHYLFLHLSNEISDLLLGCVFYLFIRLLALNWRFAIDINNIWVGTLEVRIKARLTEGRCIWLSCNCGDALYLSELTILRIAILIWLLLLGIFLLFWCLKCVELVSFFYSPVKLSTSKIASASLVLDERRLRIDHRCCQIHALLLRRLNIAISIDELDSFALLLQLGD